jgi:hypothetical protein
MDTSSWSEIRSRRLDDRKTEGKNNGRRLSLMEKNLTEELRYVCEMKVQELEMLGYEDITPEDIWKCVSEKYKEVPPLYKVVNDILSLKPGQWMNWLTMRAYKDSL